MKTQVTIIALTFALFACSPANEQASNEASNEKAELAYSFDESSCNFVLEKGMYDEYTFDDRSTFQEDVYSLVCRSTSTNRTRSNNFGLKIPIPKLKGLLGVTNDRQVTAQRIDEFCSASGSSISRNTAISWTRKIVNADTLEAWKFCLTRPAQGLRCKVADRNIDEFMITIRWDKPASGTPDPEILEEAIQSNATCRANSILSVGGIIPDRVDVSTLCQRDDNQLNSTILFQTTQGSASCEAQAVEIQSDSSTSSLLRSCLEFNLNSCVDAANPVHDLYMSHCQRRPSNEPPPPPPSGGPIPIPTVENGPEKFAFCRAMQMQGGMRIRTVNYVCSEQGNNSDGCKREMGLVKDVLRYVELIDE